MCSLTNDHDNFEAFKKTFNEKCHDILARTPEAGVAIHSPLVTPNRPSHRLTDLEKTAEFGGGSGGSGGGADDTAITESMQCYYNALAYHLKKDLNNKNATEKALKSRDIAKKVHTYNKSTRLKIGELLEESKEVCKKYSDIAGDA